MKTQLAALALLLAAPLFAGPVRPALETTLKGANGTEVKFTILAVWDDGFHARQPSGKPPLFVAWDKVDVDWLEAERPDLAKLKAAAKPFPQISPEDAKAKLDAAKKLFRAPKVVRFSDSASGLTSEAPNTLAEKYAAKVRSLTPVNITQGLSQIASDVERDAETLKGSKQGPERAMKYWLTGTFTGYLRQLERLQREIDPVAAGDVKLPELDKDYDAKKAADDEWF